MVYHTSCRSFVQVVVQQYSGIMDARFIFPNTASCLGRHRQQQQRWQPATKPPVRVTHQLRDECHVPAGRHVARVVRNVCKSKEARAGEQKKARNSAAHHHGKLTRTRSVEDQRSLRSNSNRGRGGRGGRYPTTKVVWKRSRLGKIGGCQQESVSEEGLRGRHEKKAEKN